MKSSITKYIIGAIFVLIVAAYAIWSSNNNSGSSLSMSPIVASIPFPSTTPNGQYKDGTYTGPVIDAFYGPLQVVVTVNNGTLSNVTLPVYPDEAGHTISLSERALPILAREAITAQSTNVQIVSGATQDSNAFQQSLGAALAQAQ